MAKNKHKQDPFAKREAEKYENPIPSREYILDYLAENGRPATYDDLLDAFKLKTSDEKEALRRRLIAMCRDGQLLKNRKGAYGPLDKMEMVAGRVIGHKDGFGFIVPDEGGDDLFLSPRQMRGIFHGDRVLARVVNIDHRGRREALIVEVLEQNTQQLVGRLHRSDGAAYVQPSSKRINQDIIISSEEMNGAKDGQIVVVALLPQASAHARPLGRVVEVLGDHMAPGMEISVAIRNHNLPLIWPEEAEAEAGRFAAYVQESDLNGRVDLCPLSLVTIDGEDAKDFDDAVYCEPRKNGGWKLYVAIADVSHYVKPGTPLDKEAYIRGNSVYFPGRVIPMLPETLSNNLCSLNPDVKRLAMVCEMTIDPTGRIMQYRFYEAVIQSQFRLTYKQVHRMMEANDKVMRKQFEKIVPHLTELYSLFDVLQKARKARGAIDFDLPETKIVFGRDRKIEKIVPYERFNSHRVIEECMLSANICAAKFLEKNKQGALYRVHTGPKEEKILDLRRFLQELGLTIPAHRDVVPGDYAHILRVIQDRPDAHMIQTILLRSMGQAIYSPDNRGHFGLAYDAYAHFTSPIRRYPDLLVHRAIKKLLNKEAIAVDDAALARAGEHCSMTERRADDATNEVTDWLKCEFMLDKVGQEFPGIISGVTSFGVFVELNEIYVEGLVHISTLPGDYYQFDAVRHVLVGERSGKQYRLGDPITIQVARVELDQQEIDFIIPGSTRTRTRPSKDHEKRRKKPRDREETKSSENLKKKKAKSSTKPKKKKRK